MNYKILKLLNIHPSEAGIVKRLFAVQFFLIAGSSFLFVAANAIFLSKFPIKDLPVAFFITGIFLFLFNKIYHLAEHRVSTKQLLYGIVIFSVVVTGILGILDNMDLRWMPYVLLIWYNIVYLLTGLIFWGLAASVFDVRESKRLFTIIGAGDVPAKILGYLSVSLLAPYIGLPNMVWITVILFAIAYFLSKALFKNQRIQNIAHHENPDDHHTAKQISKKKETGKALIQAIAILSFVSFASLVLIDFVFLAEVKTRYHTDIELAYFLGLFFAGGRILAVLIKLLFSSRFINYAGLTRSLLLAPVVLLAFLFFVFGVHYYLPDFQFLLYLYGIMSLLTEILKATIQEPVFLILFQPLKLSLRLRGHVIAKGYMLAASLTLVGAFLYIFLLSGPVSSGITLLTVLLGLLLVWIGSVFLVKREYIRNLHSALQRGYLSGNSLFLDDRKTVDWLLSKANGDKTSDAIFSLDLLERSGYEKIDALFASSLDKESPVLTRYILQRIRESGRNVLLPHLIELIQMGKNPEMTPEYLRTIARLDPENPVLMKFANDQSSPNRYAAIEGLLLSKNEQTYLSGKRKIEELLKSTNSSDRAEAATIIGLTGDSELSSPIEILLNDSEDEVTKAALVSVAKCHMSKFTVKIISMLDQAENRKEAITALTEMGDTSINYFAKYQNARMKPHFLKIAGSIQTEKATQYLLHDLFEDSPQFSEILQQLRKRHYKASANEREFFISLIHKKLNESDEILKMRNALHSGDGTESCFSALTAEINLRIRDVLKMLPIAFPEETVTRSVSAFLKQHKQSSNALEMLEIVIPRDIFQPLNKIIEGAEHDTRGKHRMEISEIISEIISNSNIRFNDWTRAVTIQLAGKHYGIIFNRFLGNKPDHLNPILAELCDASLNESKN